MHCFGEENELEFDVNDLESTLFEFIDQFKVLIAPETWENILLNCTKNEMLVLVHLFRKTDVNMSQIAEYLQVPLNTTTGIVDRMEKKRLVTRLRSLEDKRVVTITLTDEGKNQFQRILDTFVAYGREVISSLDTIEIALIGTVVGKITAVLQNAGKTGAETPVPKVRKIIIE